MRSLQRILYERTTRRFVDDMIQKYTDIRLSATTRAMSRKRPRIEASGVHVHKTNQDHDRGDQAERSTSSCCRTESERSSRLSSTMLDIEQSQSGKGHGRQQQNEAQLDRWRMSETRTDSEYGSGFSSTRLTRLLEEEDQEDMLVSPRRSDCSLVASTQQEEEENQEHCSSTSECDTSSTCLESASTSTQPSVGNQIEDQSELSGYPTVSPVDDAGENSPPTSSSTTTTEALLPRLRPTAPVHCVVPNCCDFFTSPHPHYPKEVIGKSDGSSNSVPSQPSSNTTSEAPDNERSDHSDDSSVADQNSDEFEMWDYVCPQYARRHYANEWV